MSCLVKAALLAPAYLSIAWTLMVSYQIFTQTAVTTVVYSLNTFLPSIGGWLTFRIDMVIFIYAFAWVFVLSSILPSLILGRERSVFVQFIVCLILTTLGFVLVDLLRGYGYDLSDPQVLFSNPFTQLFNSVYFAAFYLALPYILMITIDVLTRRRKRDHQKKTFQKLSNEYFAKR